MADKKSQPDKAKSVSPGSEYDHLVGLCEHGMLFEAEEWLRAGNSSIRPEGYKKCALRIATSMGFHSLVELLLRYGCSQEQKLHALEESTENGDIEICKLLVQAGAPVASLHYEHLNYIIRRPLIEYLLDHGLDLTLENGLAHLLVECRVKPLLGIFLQNRKRFPKWEEQASMALCEFIRRRDKKWISLMVWGGADPFLPVHELSDFSHDSDDDEWKITAVRCASWSEDLETLKMLKISPTAEQASEILFSIWYRPAKPLVESFLEAGADVNFCTNEEGSLLHKALHSFAMRNIYSTPRTEPEAEVELISQLIRKGAKWRLPDRESELNGLRRRMYSQEGVYVVEIIRLLFVGSCCEATMLKELVSKPKMKRWVQTFDPALYEKLMICC